MAWQACEEVRRVIDRFPECGTLTGQTTNHANKAIDLLTKPDIVHLVDHVNLDDPLGQVSWFAYQARRPRTPNMLSTRSLTNATM